MEIAFTELTKTRQNRKGRTTSLLIKSKIIGDWVIFKKEHRKTFKD